MAVTDEEFRALQQQMQQQSGQIQDLQKGRQEDKQEIQKLKDQLGVTQKTTDDTQKKVEETQKKVEETQQTATAAAEKSETGGHPLGHAPSTMAPYRPHSATRRYPSANKRICLGLSL